MDPITQGVFGANWALSSQRKSSKKSLIIRTLILGLLTGMAADLDILISSDTDPLMYLEFHRQFTHSIIFIPFGALICCLVLNSIFNFIKKFPKRQSFIHDYFICFMAYASHGLLDATTSYGTQLYWPFTNYRVSWDIISIIDPIFTSLLIFGLIFTVIKNNVGYSRIFLGLCFVYFALGFFQQTRAKSVVIELANKRGHTPERLTIKPSFANIILWKSIYSYNGTYYVDAIRVGLENKIYEGQTTKEFSINEIQKLVKDSQVQKEDINRFHWFSQGYISLDKNNPLYVIDVRYSMLPNEVKALWGIMLNPQSNKHVDFVQTRGDIKEVRKKLLDMISGD